MSYPCQTQIEQALSDTGMNKVTGAIYRSRKDKGLQTFNCGEYLSWTKAHDKFDYKIWFPDCDFPALADCKDKKLFRPENWGIPEDEVHDWVVFDETAVKKMLNGGFTHFFVVFDYQMERLLLWTSQHIGLGYRSWHVRLVNHTQRKYKVMFPVSSAWIETEGHGKEDWHSILNGMSRWIQGIAEAGANSIETTLHDPKFYQLGVLYQNRGDYFRTQDVLGQGGFNG